MIQTVEIHVGNVYGKVTYNLKTRKVAVDMNHEVKDDIIRYLTKEREYRIPLSDDKYDDDEIVYTVPTENLSYFNLALSELWGRFGVFVDWSTEKISDGDE